MNAEKAGYYTGMHSFSKRNAIGQSWQRFKERPFFLIGLVLITTLVAGVLEFAIQDVETGGIGLLLVLLNFFIQMLIGMGITLIMLRVYDRTETHYGDLFEPVRLFWKYLVVVVLTMIVVLVGTLLFIIPGIIASVALFFAPYLVIDRNMGPIEAMKESLHITNGHKWNIFMLGLIVAGLNLLGFLALGVGLLVTVPLSWLAAVYVFRWIENPPQEGVVVSLTSKIASVVIILLLVVSFVVLTLAVANITTGTPESRDAERKEELVEIKLAAALYKDVQGEFPPEVETLVPEFLSEVPTDPTSGEPYQYTVFGDGVDYEVCAILEGDSEEEEGIVHCEFGLDL